MKLFWTAAAIAVASLVGAPAHAGQAYMGTGTGDVVVVTVKKVSDHAATNGDPPRLELEIHEVLRGEAKADRSHAVWHPTPHDIDWGDGEKKLIDEWKARPLAGPKAGAKFVLWGNMSGDEKRPMFLVRSWHAYPFSAEKRDWAIKDVEETKERARLYAAKIAAEKRAQAKAQADWRAKVSADDLKKYATEADFVAVGRIVSEAPHNVVDGILIQLGAIQKGEKRRKYKDDAYFVEVVIPKEIRGLLDRQTDYLLFLSTDALKAGPSVDYYPLIKTGDGIVIADQKAVEAVKEGLGQK